MEYVDVRRLIAMDGLRIVLVRGTPSPWSQAAKAMIEYKGLEYAAGALEPGGTNEEVVAWAGVNSAPIVAWNDERPIDRWMDILFLLERLAPGKPLVPEATADRVRMLGLAHELFGELGLGWNRRLSLFRPAFESGAPPEAILRMGRKYRYNEADAARAPERQVATLEVLAQELKAQRERGSGYFVGEAPTAVDFYWAATCNLFDLPPPDVIPMDDAFRAMFARIEPEVEAALDPVLLEHRDRIMKEHFRIPMEV